MAVIIVMGGILGNIFTTKGWRGYVSVLRPALAAIYREMSLKTLYDLLADTMKGYATILFLIAA